MAREGPVVQRCFEKVARGSAEVIGRAKTWRLLTLAPSCTLVLSIAPGIQRAIMPQELKATPFDGHPDRRGRGRWPRALFPELTLP